MSFHGADVDGLDRTANRCMEGADFADTVARALEALVAALEAMSWTGFAAALAAYLKAVVIPWVKYIARCLRIFGGLLQLASRKQKDASEDAPPVSIPATAWNPPPAPAPVPVLPPRLDCPDPAIHRTDPGTGAEVGGGSATAPSTPVTRTEPGGTGTGGGTSVAPTTPITRTDPGSTAPLTGGGTVTTVTGIGADGRLWTRTSIGDAPTGGGTATGVGTGSLGTGALGSSGATTPASGGTPVGGTPVGGSGGGSGGPTGGSLGSGGSSPGSTAGTPEGGATSSHGTVHSSPLGSRPVSSLPTGGVGTGSVAAVEPLAAGAAGGPGAAMLAAPLGLAGVGTAALAALRATGLRPDDEEEVPDDAL